MHSSKSARRHDRHRAARAGRALWPQDDPLRVLLCSDVASEGLNLHYFCHRLVHFDLPWSLMVFQQRNGRVDRYGQKHKPHIVYLFTETQVEKIKGDLRILEILQTKDEQANKNLGDPASFLNVFDPEKEADKVGDFMATGLSPEQVEATLDAAVTAEDDNEGDWLLQLFGGGEPAPQEKPTSSLDHIHAPAGLFPGDYHFAKYRASRCFPKSQEFAQWAPDDEEQLITLTAPRDLQERLRQLPREVIDANDRLLSSAPTRIVRSCHRNGPPGAGGRRHLAELHYLWPQHPIMDWLVDRVLTQFGRHRAPVIQNPFLELGEQAFILMGLVPNRKGQPLLVDWQVATRANRAQSSRSNPTTPLSSAPGSRQIRYPTAASPSTPPPCKPRCPRP
jgi:hypothetical protein